ncbi:MAG: hypothetical protein M8467_02845 [Anaerolineae bacterium]|nr:hypothetical protein [Anaerolineae bacterium]
MDTFAEVFELLAGPPAVVGLVLTAGAIFLSSHWRLSLAALLVQYLLLAIVLTRLVQPELAIVRGLVGMLVVPILYLTARRVDERRPWLDQDDGGIRFFGVRLDWNAGALSLPLRILALLLVSLALIRFFPDYTALLPGTVTGSSQVPPDIAFASLWLAGMGTAGLLLSGDALRIAPAALTILVGFDLIYAGLEPNLAVVGFFGALTLLVSLAFSYLAGIQVLSGATAGADEEATEL